MLTIQYLEYSPDLARLDPSILVNRLRRAVDILPISHLLIGWHLPQNLLEACRLEADHLGLRFLRWQPLLTSDKGICIDPSWYAEGLVGGKVPGFQGLPEFTFLCPNHPAVQDALLKHLEAMLRQGVYQGFFLDRVRYPSPSVDPLKHLACFCDYCCRKAAQQGLDLPGLRQAILQQLAGEAGRIALVKMLLSEMVDFAPSQPNHALSQLLAFRQKSVTDFLALIIQVLKGAQLEVGLDCFSPSLAPLVGQELKSLAQLVDWVKLMTYAHTYAPAGLPYEVLGLVHYLACSTQLDEAQA
ncbi:MAG TPA: hypothetical protein VLD65_00015, partial [Anaerolineales bacterium]|nr:hypothetical protein [Anaerolineales bacterium]